MLELVLRYEVTTNEIANCSLKILEICRNQDSPPKIYLACSSEIFGNDTDSLQNEDSFLRPSSPYGVAKAFCYHIGKVFRSRMIYSFATAFYSTMNLQEEVKTLLLKK